jgi:hypothetical protein
VRPDWFPEGYLTDSELELWGMFCQERKEAMKANG